MSAPRRVGQADIKRWMAYFDARNTQGLGTGPASKVSGVPLRTAYRFERGDQRSTGVQVAKMFGIDLVGGVIVPQPLDPVAHDALEDFELFRRRYFGRISRPWQIRAAEDVLRYMATPNREYVVVNCPPGSGKSALFTHDIPVWLIARDRGIRIMLGSRTESQAHKYLRRIKRSLEREVPLRAEPDQYDLGLAVDAEGTLAEDYTAFRPPDRTDVWTGTQLNVRQLDGTTRGEKEPTVTAYGMDSGYLGDRVDWFVWDDLVDKKNTKLAETRSELFEKWDTEAQSRLEPGGLGMLVGQRIAYNDLYRHNIDKRQPDGTPKYHHIVYKAHYDDLCHGHVGDEAPSEDMAWPTGCLLDPWRVPWVGPDGLATMKGENPRLFSVLYQQEDGDVIGGLVEREWIEGGTDRFGWEAPGCLDHERMLGVVPDMLRASPRAFSMVTIDPAPDNYWAIFWTVYDGLTSTWYDIDLVNTRMRPGEFLELDLDTGQFTGILVDWWARALQQRCRIQTVIFEQSAAQKWALDRPDWQRWQQMTGCPIIGHDTTGTNKHDEKWGVTSMGGIFRTGRRRIPWLGPGTRLAFEQYIAELYRWTPDTKDRTDTVMSAWFGHLKAPQLWDPNMRPSGGTYQMPRPGFAQQAARGGQYERGMRGWR